VIQHSAFDTEPWRLRESELNLELLPQSESVFALGNGHIGWRGNLDEGEPHGLPGSYLNGVYETRPMPHAEGGYGYPESGQTLINVTDGKLIGLLVDDEPFDVRYGKLHGHSRTLDFRAGTLTREAEWTAPTGRTVRVNSVRMVSFTQRAIAAVCYEVEPLDGPARVVLLSELVANEPLPAGGKDPRASAVLASPLVPDGNAVRGTRVNLVHHTHNSGLRVAVAMDHIIEAPADLDISVESSDDLGRVTVAGLLHPGQTLRVIKFVAYGWSAERSMTGLRAQVDAALAAARQTGWDGLRHEQRQYLDHFWERADVELDGDPEVQQAVRFGLYHVLQAGARAERRAMPAKGLTGPGYDGHSFWDSEIFALPVLSYTLPEAAAHALHWRHEILPQAQRRAAELGYRGAAFPWRTISGAECSGYWPAGTAAVHINADIANAVVRYADAADDDEFYGGAGLELLVDTARFWISFGYLDHHNRFRIDGVTGPDEYSAVSDNNVYTNLMAKRNLLAAVHATHHFPERAAELGVTADEREGWDLAAKNMLVPYDERLEVHPQSEGFTEHRIWDFGATKAEDYPLMLRHPYLELYRTQVIKQADLVLAMYTCPDEFTPEQKRRNFAYYEALTVRDSSLSACVQAVLAAELGHAELARDYLGEAALMDLADLEHNTKDGVHIASLAGAWLALVAGFGGMRHEPLQPLRFAPSVPPGSTRLAFRLFFRRRLLSVEVSADAACYRLLQGEPIQLVHYDQEFTLNQDAPVELDLPERPEDTDPPRQPFGREPARRSSRAAD
jgi:alpha,alpha-trehalose phosphorylase